MITAPLFSEGHSGRLRDYQRSIVRELYDLLDRTATVGGAVPKWFDLAKIAAAVRKNEKKISDLLTRNYNQALAFNFAGTPSFVIGKTAYSGVLSQDQLRDLIKQARAA